ncbi:beta-ketoacyl-ACP synthase III [Alicyclobacillus cycloheptanicus]|uniref:Beta-ketoacyl-[acyl-carrier-protein] synthase III n=1 Tax=Alicyclobacillus cycloheptanicus TaxID=1457 RepID=A0ABT9XMA5_9BACL|nr:beta-ketoacyl-ACP synthase III [Alicyclobacillus cycloheptanicus]MDQ0190863.1 3-oxoacyl-[acyl-carrier-protein] synthase-3 [Alicyclobacillus cycloheptanicus]
MTIRAGILGTGSAVPSQILSNADLEKMVETNDEWIVTRTGIRERRIAQPHEATSDFAIPASQRALEMAGVRPEEVDLIICATVTPDMMFPATACIIQDKIGATRAAAFDLSAACSGFLYGLSVAAGFIASGQYRYVLVVAADVLSRIVDYTDRSTAILFGDGAGAALVGPVEGDRGLLAFDLGADGSGGEFLSLPAGGSRMPASYASIDAHLHYLKMEGQETFKSAVKAMAASTEKVLERAGLKREDVDLMVPHQANIRIIEAARKRFGFDENKVVLTIHKYGNSSASSIAIALDESIRAGRAQPGHVLILVGFGAGLTWGAAALRL